jgi:hypothetical protein
MVTSVSSKSVWAWLSGFRLDCPQSFMSKNERYSGSFATSSSEASTSEKEGAFAGAVGGAVSSVNSSGYFL